MNEVYMNRAEHRKAMRRERRRIGHINGAINNWRMRMKFSNPDGSIYNNVGSVNAKFKRKRKRELILAKKKHDGHDFVKHLSKTYSLKSWKRNFKKIKESAIANPVAAN